MRTLYHLLFASFASALTYDVKILRKGDTPAVSLKNAAGNGYSPCQFTFNPAWIPDPSSASKGALIVRASGCPTDFGGSGDHLLMVNCTVDAVTGGSCSDVSDVQFTGFESTAEDPRVFEYDGFTYLFYFAAGAGQATVYLRKTQTPFDPASWVHVAGPLAWHRNGCTIIRADGKHRVLFGESPPLPGLGIAETTDFITYNVINATFMTPLGANNSDSPEIVIEAGSTPVLLSTGDYLHLYAAGTPGWVANGESPVERRGRTRWLFYSRPPPQSITRNRQLHGRLHYRRGRLQPQAALRKAPLRAHDGL